MAILEPPSMRQLTVPGFRCPCKSHWRGEATLFSIPAFDTLASAINSIWVRHARRRGTGREQPLGQLCRIMLQCILVAVSHSFFFFWAKIESRPNCVNFTPHFSNCFAARSRPALPFPPLIPIALHVCRHFQCLEPRGAEPFSPAWLNLCMSTT